MTESDIDMVKATRDKVGEAALKYIQKTIPEKIVSLNKLIESNTSCVFDKKEYESGILVKNIPFLHALRKKGSGTCSSDSDSSSSDEDEETTTTTSSSFKKQNTRKRSRAPPAKKPRTETPNGLGGTTAVHDMIIHSHKNIVEGFPRLKNEVNDMVRMAGQLKLWIQLNIPRIEDGNNFGVGVQEEVVGEIGRTEDHGYAILDSITKYHLTRAKLLTKVVKYPEIEDFHATIIDLDQKQFHGLHICIVDLRNSYVVLLDTIKKNFDKILKPRTENNGNMY